MNANPRFNNLAAEVDVDVSVASVISAIRVCLAEIQDRSREVDALGCYPAEDVALLRRLGALEVFAGGTPTALELMEALRLVGRANLSLGRIFEGHVNGARLIAWYGDARQRRALGADLRAGKVFGVWNTEPTPGVQLTRLDSRPVLTGCKSYATGAGHIDRAVITAAEPEGGRRMLVVDANDPSRADRDAWNVRGMKATGSGTYDFSGLDASAFERLGQVGDYEREPRFSAGAWRFTAVQLGGVERVISLLRDHLAASPSGSDPVHRARFGLALAGARSAYLWVREAAQRAERPNAGPDEIAFVLMTRGVVERAGLEAMEAAARTVGTRAFFADHPLDLACRDLAMYLRQPAPDQALDRAAQAFIAKDCWQGDPLW